MRRFQELVDIVGTLRDEGGCPWDRAQTPETMRPYLLEEAHEVLDAIDRADLADLRRELGDLLFQVVFLARMAEERGAFDIDDVLAGVCRKMVDRHPHVFDPSHEDNGDEGGIEAWEARKARERPRSGSALDGVPLALPALLRAHRISEKASAVGFDWRSAAGVRAKLDEELAELDEAMGDGDGDAIGAELGQVLFTVVNLGRHLPVDAETALRQATATFEQRFRRLEHALTRRGTSIQEHDAESLEALWRSPEVRD